MVIDGEGHDILLAEMNKRILWALYPVLMVGSGIVLALTSAVATPDLFTKSGADAAAVLSASTPTPIPEVISQGGSTDGIMVMGVVIVIIVLLPILLRRSIWTK